MFSRREATRSQNTVKKKNKSVRSFTSKATSAWSVNSTSQMSRLHQEQQLRSWYMTHQPDLPFGQKDISPLWQQIQRGPHRQTKGHGGRMQLVLVTIMPTMVQTKTPNQPTNKKPKPTPNKTVFKVLLSALPGTSIKSTIASATQKSRLCPLLCKTRRFADEKY